MKKGIVTIAFDDAYLDTLRHAVRYLNRLKIPSTIAVPHDLIGKKLEKRPVAGRRELKNALDRGHEIASHTLTHRNLLRLSSQDYGETITEISASKKFLENTLNARVDSFVFPYIEYNQSRKLRSIAKKYYKTSRITSYVPCFNKTPLRNPYFVKGFAVMKKHAISYLNRQIDHAARNKLWLIEVFHLVAEKNTLSAHRPEAYRFFMQIKDFKEHIRYILSRDIIIMTQGEVVRQSSRNISR